MAFTVCEKVINILKEFKKKEWFIKEIELVIKQWKFLHNSHNLEMYFNEIADRYFNTRKYEKARTLYIKAKNIMKQDFVGERLPRIIELYLIDILRCECGIKDNEALKLMRDGDRLCSAGKINKALIRYKEALNLAESNTVEYRNSGLIVLLKGKLTSI